MCGVAPQIPAFVAGSHGMEAEDEVESVYKIQVVMRSSGVCVCVCVNVCMVCANVCLYVMYVRVYVCMCVCTYVYTPSLHRVIDFHPRGVQATVEKYFSLAACIIAVLFFVAYLVGTSTHSLTHSRTHSLTYSLAYCVYIRILKINLFA